MPCSYMLDSCQEYQIRQQQEVTWEQGPIRALASITLQRNLISTTSWGCPEHQLAAISGHWLRLACSGWPAGFESTCVWSSKVEQSTEQWQITAYWGHYMLTSIEDLPHYSAHYTCQWVTQKSQAKSIQGEWKYNHQNSKRWDNWRDV